MPGPPACARDSTGTFDSGGVADGRTILVNVAYLGRSGPRAVISARPTVSASGPLRRTTPIPPRPAGVAIATIVSCVEKAIGLAPDCGVYLRAEIITVFENASPTLSVVA